MVGPSGVNSTAMSAVGTLLVYSNPGVQMDIRIAESLERCSYDVGPLEIDEFPNSGQRPPSSSTHVRLKDDGSASGVVR